METSNRILQKESRAVIHSESDLSQAFLAALNRYPGIELTSDSLIAEFASKQGRPDFVGASHKLSRKMFQAGCHLESALRSGPVTRIFSELKPNAPRTRAYLEQVTGLPDSVVAQILKNLCSKGLIRSANNSSYVLPTFLTSRAIEFWAFELKMDNWKRALYQALQYQAFAHRVTVVLSEKSHKRVTRNLEAFRSKGIGVLLLNESNGELVPLCKARRMKPKSALHYYYALGRFLESVLTK